MKLATYLEQHKLKPAQFAERLNKPASTIHRILNGDRQPGMALLEEIMAATDGAVTPNDFLKDARDLQGDAA